MIILGIDPGLEKMGYGVIESVHGKDKCIDYGIVWSKKTDKETGYTKTLPERLLEIEQGVNELIDTYKPDQIAIEELFFTKNVTNGIAVAEARGVILLSCIKKIGNEVYEYTPNQIKSGLTGNAEADKKQMIRVVELTLGLKEGTIPLKYDDAADALAGAIVHAHTNQINGGFRLR